MKIQSLKGEFDLAALLKAAKDAKNGSIVVIKGYTAKDGSISNYYLNFKTSYENTLKKSLELIIETENVGFDQHEFDSVKEDLIKSLTEKINGSVEIKTSNYLELVPGIKFHPETGNVYISGILIPDKEGDLKVIIKEKEVSKPVKSKERTLIKKALEEKTPLARYRTFTLNGNFESISLVKQ